MSNSQDVQTRSRWSKRAGVGTKLQEVPTNLLALSCMLMKAWPQRGGRSSVQFVGWRLTPLHLSKAAPHVRVGSLPSLPRLQDRFGIAASQLRTSSSWRSSAASSSRSLWTPFCSSWPPPPKMSCFFLRHFSIAIHWFVFTSILTFNLYCFMLYSRVSNFFYCHVWVIWGHRSRS